MSLRVSYPAPNRGVGRILVETASWLGQSAAREPVLWMVAAAATTLPALTARLDPVGADRIPPAWTGASALLKLAALTGSLAAFASLARIQELFHLATNLQRTLVQGLALLIPSLAFQALTLAGLALLGGAAPAEVGLPISSGFFWVLGMSLHLAGLGLVALRLPGSVEARSLAILGVAWVVPALPMADTESLRLLGVVLGVGWYLPFGSAEPWGLYLVGSGPVVALWLAALLLPSPRSRPA